MLMKRAAMHAINQNLTSDRLLDALERLKRHAGFEFGFLSSSFGFHFGWFRLGSRPVPDHHHQRLTPGSNFGVRLKSC